MIIKLIKHIIICLSFGALFFYQCANPGVVTGGPKDSIPPVLISSYPVDQTINFNEQTITLTFDELIAAEKIKQSLIISPTTSIKFKHLIKKRTITLKFEEPFKDSTTYTFNFFDAITDITEKNPPVNLVLAFSTGDFIDSLKIFGNVKDLMTGKSMEKTIVGLYAKTDSMDLFKDKPTYFTTTDKYGVFSIQNIKYGDYKLFAFEDKNKNLLPETKEEAYGFKTGFFNPTNIPDSLYIFTINVDASPLKLNAARINGKYFDMRYSKRIDSYKIIDQDPDYTIHSSLGETGESVRFYNPFNGFPNDSALVVVQAFDSLKNSSIDTVYIAFRESSRKKEAFSTQLQPSTGSNISDDQKFTVKFNKPVIWADSTIYIRYDSIHSFSLETYNHNWNHNKTQITLAPQITQKQILDSLEAWKSSIVIDSLQPDSMMLFKKTLLENYNPNKLSISFLKNAFISIEEDTSAVITGDYKFKVAEDFGTLRVTVNKSSDQKFFIQLTDEKKSQVFDELYNCTICEFRYVKPGNYSLRLLVDSNEDQYWDIGNVLDDREPEPVLHYDEETVIRSNFDLELNIDL